MSSSDLPETRNVPDPSESLTPRFIVAILAAGKSTRMGGVPKLCLPWHASEQHRTVFGDQSATVVSHLVGVWTCLGAERVYVIHGAEENDPVSAELRNLFFGCFEANGLFDSKGVSSQRRCFGVIPTRNAQRDMMGSIQTAASHLVNYHSPKAAASPLFGACYSTGRLPANHCNYTLPEFLIIALGDQPHLQVATLQNLTDAASNPDNERSILRPRFNGRGGHPIGIPKHLIPGLAATDMPTLKHFLQLHVADIVDVLCEDPGLTLDIDTPEDYQAALKLDPPVQ